MVVIYMYINIYKRVYPNFIQYQFEAHQNTL